MRHLLHSFLIFTALLCCGGCTIFKRSIPKPVTIVFTDTAFQASLVSSAMYTKYVDAAEPYQVSESFLKGFWSEAGLTKNVNLTSSSDNADFTLRIKSLSLSESSKTEKISDSKSKYNGMEMVLNTVDCQAEIEVIDNRSSHKTMYCYNSKTRSEKIKNNRDVGDLIFGTNKDRSEYRTKLLQDDICIQLSEDVGRRIWVPITRKIAKHLK